MKKPVPLSELNNQFQSDIKEISLDISKSVISYCRSITNPMGDVQLVFKPDFDDIPNSVTLFSLVSFIKFTYEYIITSKRTREEATRVLENVNDVKLEEVCAPIII